MHAQMFIGALGDRMTDVYEALERSANVAVAQSGPAGSALGDFWNLVEQAGPLRWPIFAVLAIGLMLLIAKLYELLRDRSVSRPLFEADLRSATLADITRLVAKQQESMLTSLQSAMLNVFQTRPSEGMLHDEIANFVSFRQEQFGVFRRRMEVLSDTAGALGLMGTVWGMFVVFFQGTSDKDVILRGMGIALITTLLGLTVSIILNLSATEVSTFFGKRLEQVSKKSDELRFRLLELAAASGVAVASEIPREETVQPVVRAAAKPAEAPPRPVAAEPDRAASGAPNVWHFKSESDEYVAAAGEVLRGLCLALGQNGGTAGKGVAVAISIPSEAGLLNGGRTEIRAATDDQGRVRFDWKAPERAGTFALQAAVPGHLGPGHRVTLRARPGAPHRLECEGNHQAAVAGMRLSHPLRVTVSDRFGNPVPGVRVAFKVRGGNGRFGRHGNQIDLTTGADGTAQTVFAVSDEAGSNVVVATVQGVKDSAEFVAFGTEV